METTLSRVRAFLIFEAATFLVAATIHFGWLFTGYGHQAAGTAESVIAVILLAGLALTWSPAPWAFWAGAAAQLFAILGVFIGLYVIAIGIGPRTVPDVVYHGAIVGVLVAGLKTALDATSPARARL